MPLGLAALDDLFSAFEELRAAMDGVDVAAIDAASARVGHAAAHVRAVGAWRNDPAVVERLSALLPLIEAARVRTNLLADHAGRRLSLLASYGARQAPLVYAR
ncbi:MAG: hypothetical protein ABW039_05315 [Sphingobium sp.]